MISRREFVQVSSTTFALSMTAAARQLKTVGVQLYTVRKVLPRKSTETLRAIEAIGYREVEATYASLDQIWPALQATKLKPVSIHIDSNLILKATSDDLRQAIDQVKQHGFAYAVFPYLPPSERAGLDQMRAFADKLNHAAELCHSVGLRFCYHNHAFEFEPMDGATRLQVLIDNTDKKLVGFELDVFWVSVAGQDPTELLHKLSGRVPLIHLKDKASGTQVMYKESVPRTAFKEVGNGVLDWTNILRAAQSAGVSHYFVEQDETPGDPVDSLRQSFTYLSKLNF